MALQHILIVEDEFKIAQLLKDYLEREGYKTICLSRGDEVLAQMRRQPPDLVLLDIMLPGKDGMAVCRDIRGFSPVPVIMITARVEELDRVLGLELGADDYICKPFSPREVVARVKAVLRRTSGDTSSNRFAAGPIVLDPDAHEVTVNGSPLPLTPNEFALLKVLLKRPNRVFTRSEIVNLVQGYEFQGYERTIDTHVKNLRKKLSHLLPDRDVIETVYGVGYKLIV